MSDPFKEQGEKVGGGKEQSPFVKLGNDPAKGHVTHVRGLLLDVRESTKFPGQMLYDMRGTDGKRFTLVGNFGIDDKVKSEHIGDAFDITFEGMVVTKSKKTAKNFTIIRLKAKDIPEGLFPEEAVATVAGDGDLPF